LKIDRTGVALICSFVFCLLAAFWLEAIGANVPYKSQVENGSINRQTDVEGREHSELPRSQSPTQSSQHSHNAAGDQKAGDKPSQSGNWIWGGDGLAQWAMVAISLLALFVSIYVVCLLRATLKATNNAVRIGAKANIAAATAAKEANSANKIMRDEQRPWLDFKFSETCELGFTGERSASLAGLNPLITNKGKSPAVRVWLSLRLIETNMTLYEADEFESVVRE